MDMRNGIIRMSRLRSSWRNMAESLNVITVIKAIKEKLVKGIEAKSGQKPNISVN